MNMKWYVYLGYRLIGMAVVLAAVVAVAAVIVFYSQFTGPHYPGTPVAAHGFLVMARYVWQEERDIPLDFNYPGGVFTTAITSSLILIFGSIFLAALVALPLGTYAAIHNRHWLRHVGTLGTLTAQGIPPYVMAVGLLFFFATLWRWFPISGWNSPASAVLPTVALAAGNVGYMAKFMQAGMTEVLQKHYIVHARARGLSESAVLVRHALRPAVVATVTFFGPQAAMLVNNMLVVDLIFTIPGLTSILGGGLNGGVGTPYGQSNTELAFFLLALMVLVLNLLIDLSYRYLNPMTARTA